MQVDGTTGGTGTPTAAEALALANTSGTSDSDMLYFFSQQKSGQEMLTPALKPIKPNIIRHGPERPHFLGKEWVASCKHVYTLYIYISLYCMYTHMQHAYIHIESYRPYRLCITSGY